MFSIANGFLFLSQIVFTCNTPWSLPRFNERKDKVGTLLFSENHWTTMKTTKQFVHKILLPYLHIQISQFTSQENQRMAWLLDYWFVHKSHEFLDWWSKHTQPSWDTIDKIGIDLWKRPNRIKNPNLLEPQYKPPNWGSIPQFTLRNWVMGFWNKTWDKHGLSQDTLWLVPLGQPSVVPRWH